MRPNSFSFHYLHLWIRSYNLGFIIWQDDLTFWNVIALCYNWQIITLKSYLPFIRIWDLHETFVTHYERLCFETKLRALGPWGCFPFYHIHVLGASLKKFFYEKVHNYLIEKETIFLIMNDTTLKFVKWYQR
jgi:hypothetical protein